MLRRNNYKFPVNKYRIFVLFQVLHIYSS